MRTALIIAFVVMFGAGVAMAQVPGSIGIFNDAQGLDCELTTATTVLTIHVIHLWTDGATGSQFKIELPLCLSGIGQSASFELTQGNFWVNTSIAYQVCLVGPIYLGSMLAVDSGCPDCSYVRVVANSDVPPYTRAMVDCSSPDPQLYETAGGAAIYKAQVGVCECNVPAGDSSWGQIKALFQ